jgi:protein TonB
MTNKEILQADLLDILFEHRNKLYGAYTLRKTYTHRLGLALAVALSTVLLFILMSFINKKDNGDHNRNRSDIVKITPLVIPDDKPKDPEPPRDKPKPPTAQVDYQPPTIVEDDKVKEDLVDINDIINANIGNQNLDGDKPNDIANAKTEPEGNGDISTKVVEKNDAPILPSHGPTFPGGTEAWLGFLQRYLQSPEDLEPGQRIEVQVRFWIDVDGKVSKPEIIKSGGSSFDKEVLRVMKKMPRWDPAMQNGNFIAVPYTQPVIFLGVEQ